MFELDRFKDIASNAHKLFPDHLEISLREFRQAKKRYFKTLENLEVHDKGVLFNSTYYCEGGVCWFLLKETRYFSIIINPGSIQELHYYGKIM